jgi:hypothetical protein
MRATLPHRTTVGRSLAFLAAVTLLAGWPDGRLEAQTPASYSTPRGLSPELLGIRAALDKYRDPVVAVHDGYLSSVACVEYPKGGGSEGTMHYAPGGMGVHFLNLQFIGPTLDPTKPQVLIYEPDGDRLRLAAAEWFVPAQAAGQTRPAIFKQELQGPMEGHEPVQPKGMHHYDLHVWLWKENPAGTFSPTNPAVTCPKGGYSFAEHAPKMVPPAGH